MSIGLALALAGLTSLALAWLLVPLLLRQSRSASRDAYNLTVYRDQLAELDRDSARGLLSPAEAEAARAEIGRRILALGPTEAATQPARMLLLATAVAILLVPVAALTLYARLGSPSLPDQPFAERATSGQTELKEALAKLRTHLQARPDDLTGWLLLARTELGLGNFADAAEAYRRAAELSGNRPDIAGDWGEAQVLAAGGSVTPMARRAFEAALSDPDTAPRSRYYLALARMQQGDPKGAMQDWRDLEAASPRDAEWLPLLRQRIAEAAAAQGADPPAAKPEASGMPSQEAVAAAAQAAMGASPEERRAMIDAMVARLAARLEQQPDDAEGWARLGRSYMVLEQPDKAREAYARAVSLKPGDESLRQALADAEARTARGGAPAGP